MPRRPARLAAFVCVLVCVLAPAWSPASSGAAGAATRPGRSAGTPQVRLPPVDAPADYQLGGAYAPDPGVVVVSRDRTDRPAGGYDLCYVNAFQTQPGDLGWWRRHHPRLLLRDHGRLVRDPGWPDEVLLDTRTRSRQAALGAVLTGWAAGCARSGFDAVEPDNLDSWTRSHHLLTRAGNLAVARRLVLAGHRRGLAVAQKNTAGLTTQQVRRAGFDFAVAEDCQVYAECGWFRRHYGDHVLEIEYADEGRAGFREACSARGAEWSIVYRDRDLRVRGQRGYVRDAC